MPRGVKEVVRPEVEVDGCNDIELAYIAGFFWWEAGS